MYDIIIAGSGPAGLSAAVYAARAQLSAVIIEKEFMGTGQIVTTERVDNYLGLPGLSGYDIGDKFREHAASMGAEFMDGEITQIAKAGGTFTVTLADGRTVEGKTVIYAAGAVHRKLGVPGEDLGGVSYCAVCDGGFHKGKDVAVVGGGDTALEDAEYMSRIANKVYLIHRRDEFRGNRSAQERVKNAPNIELVLCATVKEIRGEGSVAEIVVDQKGEERVLPVSGVFAAVGTVPNSKPVEGLCELEGGYLKAGEDGITSCPGLYAAGDVRTKALRQLVTAVSDGANCVTSAEGYLRA